MDFWQNLIEHSTAPAGSDVWTHSMSQEGGGTNTQTTVLVPFPVDELSAGYNEEFVMANIDDELCEAECLDDINAAIADDTTDINITVDEVGAEIEYTAADISLEIPDDTLEAEL